MIDILVLNYNDANTTIRFIDSVKTYACVSHVLVVDNHSSDDSLEKLRLLENEKTKVVCTEKNGGYGAGNNFGIRYLKKKYNSEFILLCNPDVVIDEHTCIELENFLRNHKDYAIAAPFMLDANGKKQNNTAFQLPSKMVYISSLCVFAKKYLYTTDCGLESAKSKMLCCDVGGVSGSLFMMNTDLMMKYGMYDENIFLYCEEIVLGKKMQSSGKKIALLPHLTFVHNHSVSISKTYSSIMKRHKLLIESKSYVIDTYFRANIFDKFVKWIFIMVSFIEIIFVNLYHKIK